MMPRAKIDMFSSAPPREHVEEPEQTARLRDELAHRVAIDAGRRDEHADAVDRHHRHA